MTSSEGMLDLGTVITAMITPMNKGGDIDYDKMADLSRYLIENGSDSLLVAGTTGESPTLTHEEELELLFCVKSAIGTEAKIVMGAGSNSTITAVEMSEKVQEAGCDAILSVVPYYNKPNQKDMISHFSSIAKSVDIPIILYNIPSRTGVNMEPETVCHLANEFKNIVAIKQSSPNLDAVSEMRKICPKDFEIYCGDDSLILPMMALGAKGTISVASHIVGNKIKQMIDFFKSGNNQEALELHLRLFPLFKALFVAPNPVPVKSALSKMGFIENSVRRPLNILDIEKECELYNILKEYI